VPSGLFPYCRIKPTSSFIDCGDLCSLHGSPDDVVEMTVALLSLGALLLQAKPCRPVQRRASTALPHTHVWGSNALHPSLCTTAILIYSSDSRSPTDVIGGAASQSPECGDMMLPTVWLCQCQWWHATRPLLHVAQLAICAVHALWMCADSAPGFWLLDNEVHLVSTAGRDSSSNDPTDSGRMDC